MVFGNQDNGVNRKKLLPALGLLILIVGVFSPTLIITDKEYTIYDLNSYVEGTSTDSGKGDLVNLLNSLISLITVAILLSIPFALLSLKYQSTALITSILVFLAGLFEIIFFIVFTQLTEYMGQSRLFLSYSPFIFFISAAIFLLHNYRTKMNTETEIVD